MQDVTSLTE